MKKNVYDLFLKAKDLKRNNKIDESIKILEMISKMEPYNSTIKFELAKTYVLKKGMHNKAKDMFIELLYTNNKIYAMLELGKLEINDKNYGMARHYFKQLLDISKSRNYALLELGRLEKACGNMDLAEGYFKELLDTPNRNYALLELGRLKKKLKDNDSARKYFKELLNTNNKNDKIFAIQELSKIEIIDGNYQLARNYLIQLLDDNRKYALCELSKLEKKCGNDIMPGYCFNELLSNIDNEVEFEKSNNFEKIKTYKRR